MARFDSFAAKQAQALQITTAQHALWDAYVQTKKDRFANKRPGADYQKMGDMTADERAEWPARYLEAATQHARQMANSTKPCAMCSRPSNATASIG